MLAILRAATLGRLCLTGPILCTANKYQMARSRRSAPVLSNPTSVDTQIQAVPSLGLSTHPEEQLVPHLHALLAEDARQEMQLLLSKQFYESMEYPEYITQLLQTRTSVDWYYRDYPEIKMSLANQEIYSRMAGLDPYATIWMKRALVAVLSDSAALQQLCKENKLVETTHYLTFSVKAVCRLMLTSSKKDHKALVNLVNLAYEQIVDEAQGRSSPEIKQCFSLMRKESGSSLNIRERMLFNLLAFSIYNDSAYGQEQKNQPMKLYKKIAEGGKLTPEDLVLSDYEKFLDYWLGAKNDEPVEWQDLPPEELAPYFKFLYIIAETHYMNKQPQKCAAILSRLPADYPLRRFLELSQLYDTGQYAQLQQAYDSLQQQYGDKSNPYFKLPENDLVFLNIMKVVAKAKKENKEQQEEWQANIELFMNYANMENLKEEGMPHYYFDLPYLEVMVDEHFWDLYQ